MQSTEDEKDPVRDKAIAFVFSNGLPELFRSLRLSLAATTYQAQRLMLFSASNENKMTLLMRVFPRPTGLAVEETRMALACRHFIWIFRTGTDIREPNQPPLPHDRIYLPRKCHVTGDIEAHQIAWLNNRLYVINTRFSCLSTLEEDWSFVPGWRPPFISRIVPEDRCHLNGFCHDNHEFRYATALGDTDTEEGWRKNRAKGGVVIDMCSGEIVSRGLSMPHSPVLYSGKLWLLESGTGSLLCVDPRDGTTTSVARFPGFLRGLAFHDRYAFVGTCRAREHKTFGGLPIQEHSDNLICGVHVLDIVTGNPIGFIEFTKGVDELFDIRLIVGPKDPHIFGTEDPIIQRILIVPGN